MCAYGNLFSLVDSFQAALLVLLIQKPDSKKGRNWNCSQTRQGVDGLGLKEISMLKNIGSEGMKRKP